MARLSGLFRPRVAAGASAVLALGALALVAALVLRSASDAPAEPTTERYADLFAQREVRASEAPLPPVLPLPVAAATPEAAEPAAPAILDAPVAAIRIEKLGVDARVVPMGLMADGTMESPTRPELVAWYDFTAKPGTGGNAVLSGHVDYRGYGPAVFYNLRRLVQGDRIEIALEDGSVIAYEVTASKLYPVELVPMREVLAATASDSLTLITRGGSFDGHSYSDRLVLRAVKVGVTSAP
jgi:sortase (surface protein transpeptidase)